MESGCVQIALFSECISETVLNDRRTEMMMALTAGSHFEGKLVVSNCLIDTAALHQQGCNIVLGDVVMLSDMDRVCPKRLAVLPIRGLNPALPCSYDEND